MNCIDIFVILGSFLCGRGDFDILWSILRFDDPSFNFLPFFNGIPYLEVALFLSILIAFISFNFFIAIFCKGSSIVELLLAWFDWWVISFFRAFFFGEAPAILGWLTLTLTGCEFPNSFVNWGSMRFKI